MATVECKKVVGLQLFWTRFREAKWDRKPDKVRQVEVTVYTKVCEIVYTHTLPPSCKHNTGARRKWEMEGATRRRKGAGKERKVVGKEQEKLKELSENLEKLIPARNRLEVKWSFLLILFKKKRKIRIVSRPPDTFSLDSSTIICPRSSAPIYVVNIFLDIQYNRL